MNRAQTLDKAKECVLKDRQSTHGKPEDSFGLIAKFWSSYTGHDIKPHDVAVMMGLLKIARIKHKPLNEDNWVDFAGYAACGSELAEQLQSESFWTKTLEDLRFLDSPSPLPSSCIPPHLRSDTE